MCGITGFVDFKKNSGLQDLKAMTDALVHRGPDGEGHFIAEEKFGTVGLGHRRLSIIDLEGSSQPMTYKHLTITFNGEIYNYKEIRENLENLGHHFHTAGDTEVILHAYEEWGEQCMKDFRGMFAYCIFDSQKEELFLVRDRAGVKPFFYSWQNDSFIFGSELKSLTTHPRFKKEIHLPAVAAFVQFGNVPSNTCIYKNTFKLKPGHFMKVQLSRNNAPQFLQQQYWSVYTAYNKPKNQISFEEAKTQTSKILKESFELRMVADVPVGVFLSGGFDSACVTAMLQKDRTDKLKTYTIAVPDIGLNEAPYAKDIANHLGTDHTTFDCTHKEALDVIPDLPHFYDEPYADSSAIPTSLLSKLVKQDVTVALSADAGDEIFAGYNRYDYLMRFGTKLNRIPKLARSAAAGVMDVIQANKIPVLKNKYNFANRYEKVKNLLSDPSAEQMMWSLSKQFSDKEMSTLFTKNIILEPTAYHSRQLQTEFWNPLHYMMAIDYETYLVDDILQKVDRATMSASLEGREPFLDHKIIEFVGRLPHEYKYHHGEKKYLLKQIVYDYIPKKLMDRPKMGFAIPIENWMCQELRPMVEDFLSFDRIKKQGIFNPLSVEGLKNEFLNGKAELGNKIWYLVSFQMWYDKNFANS